MTSRSECGAADQNASPVVAERQQLLNVAYRLLGSLADAEDVVQETYTRWYAMQPAEQEAIEVPAAWLTKVAGRICLDLLRSARVRREKYVGQWLPEPLPDRAEWVSAPSGGGSPAPVDPADRITLDESITMAFLVMLEQMTPRERVALILHDVFGYSFAEIGEIVGRTPAACRQLASSARRRMQRTHPVSVPDRQVDLVRDFKDAWQAKDITMLVNLLDPDGTMVSDGGGNAAAAPDPIEGSEQIARFFADIADTPPGVKVLERTVNGRPGLIAQAGGVTVTVFAFDLKADRIAHIWAVRNPDKLHPWM